MRSRYLHPHNDRPVKVIQGNTITLAQSDELHMQKYGKFMETRCHELEQESKMSLLEAQAHTCERRDYEADKERQEKGKGRRSICQRRGKRVKKIPPNHPMGGGGARICPRKKTESRSSVTTLARVGEVKLCCCILSHYRGSFNECISFWRRPPAPAGGSRLVFSPRAAWMLG